jgi:voltage-gated potassium channel
MTAPEHSPDESQLPAQLSRNSDAYDRFSAAVDGPLMVISIAWLPILIVPLATHLRGSTARAFDLIDYVVWALFAIEYLSKLYLAPSRKRFFTTHLLDLAIVVLPFLRPIRVLRVLRFLRAGTTFTRSTARLRAAFVSHGLHFVLLFAAIVVFACAGIVLGVERNAAGSNIHNFADALWWAIVTVTTVGYGDRFPVTEAGRGVAVLLMLVGIGLIGVITANVASFFVDEKTDKVQLELVEVRAQLERIEGLLAARTADQT